MPKSSKSFRAPAPYQNASDEVIRRIFSEGAMKPYKVRAIAGDKQANCTDWEIRCAVQFNYRKVQPMVTDTMRKLAVGSGMCINGVNIIGDAYGETIVYFKSVLGRGR